jgi:hypothetical protein
MPEEMSHFSSWAANVQYEEHLVVTGKQGNYETTQKDLRTQLELVPTGSDLNAMM